MRLSVLVVIVIIVVVALVAVVVVCRALASLLVDGGALSQTFVVTLEVETGVGRALQNGLHRLSVGHQVSVSSTRREDISKSGKFTYLILRTLPPVEAVQIEMTSSPLRTLSTTPLI